MNTKHTPGPWRWEYNREHKVLHLVGGRPQYDLTILDFDRWGMNRAIATLRDPDEDGMNVMHRLSDRPDWVAAFPGRAHHASWCADVTRPDMRLMAAAPDLLDALQVMVRDYGAAHASCGDLEMSPALFQAQRAITKATGERE